VTKLFQHPTIRAFAKYLADTSGRSEEREKSAGEGDVLERSSSRRRFNRARLVSRRTAITKDEVGSGRD
jgi:hypothetical protein